MSSRRIYICSVCGRFFPTPVALRNHIVKTHLHAGRGRWKCPFCGKVFTNKHALRAHVCRDDGLRPHCAQVCWSLLRSGKSMRYEEFFEKWLDFYSVSSIDDLKNFLPTLFSSKKLVVISMKLPQGLLNIIDFLSKSEKISRTELIRRAIVSYIRETYNIGLVGFGGETITRVEGNSSVEVNSVEY